MIGRNFLTLIRRSACRPAIQAPKRNFAQVGLAVSTPPRCPCSYGLTPKIKKMALLIAALPPIFFASPEKILHALFMLVVWLSPMAYFLTQIKVWRREYID
ncbi:hypothetical protein KGM_206266 [Danaus plexippus plexippus]|uniref:Uncharacterized protein n=1 Tax=Danaus plexippus plexippus TaxID=278856 RepID=A0A212F3A9_DANPL|nr:hypothetical protein KGM_206266 [Danaus plexippus plexippus]